MARQRTADDSMTYWFPWKHPITRRRGLEFVVFDQTSSRPCGPCCSILFPPQNYHSQSIGSALRATPFVSFCAFAQKHNPNVGSALQPRLSSVANAPGPNFSPFRCALRCLEHAAIDSDHTECVVRGKRTKGTASGIRYSCLHIMWHNISSTFEML